MAKIDYKEIQIGFWVGLGLFLFTTLAGLLTRVWAKTLGEARDGS